MWRYVLVRVLQAVPVVLGITVASFLLIHLVPGDPARLQLGPHAKPAQVEELRDELGLDRPLPAQYLDFLGEAVKGRFGTSVTLHQSVGSVIAQKLGVTLLLLVYSILISLVLAIPLGLTAAVRKDTATDHVIRAAGMVFYVMPVFWLGLLLVLVFGLILGVFPTSGYQSGVLGSLRSLTLPAVTLGVVLAPLFIRTLRASLIQTLDAGFIEAARSRGYSSRRILYRHALRPASISTITLVGLMIGSLISGMVVVESLFSIPGLGAQLVASVSARDFPMIEGLVCVLAVMVVIVNLATDLAYAVADPRVRL